MVEKLRLKKNKFFQLWLIIGIIAGFVAVLFFSITYLNEKVLCDMDCRIQNEVSIVLILVSLFGMFVGSLTYYFISEKYEKKIIKMQKDANLLLKFLESEERLIIKSILNHGGKTTQSEIVKETGLSRVKIFRILKKLEGRGAIVKKPNGMTNYVELEQKLTNVLLE
jgi:uncharacterized membrane protein